MSDYWNSTKCTCDHSVANHSILAPHGCEHTAFQTGTDRYARCSCREFVSQIRLDAYDQGYQDGYKDGAEDVY